MPISDIPIAEKGFESGLFGEKMHVEWRYTTPFTPASIPQYTGFIETVRKWGQNPDITPEQLDENILLTLQRQMESKIQHSFSAGDRRRMINDLETNAVHTLPRTAAYLNGFDDLGIIAKFRRLSGVR
jgi:hypothetical protein